MTETADRLEEAETEVLDGLSSLHQQLIDANERAADQLAELREWGGSAPKALDPGAAVQRYYDFAGKLLEANRSFAEQIIAVWYPAKDTPKAKK